MQILGLKSEPMNQELRAGSNNPVLTSPLKCGKTQIQINLSTGYLFGH